MGKNKGRNAFFFYLMQTQSKLKREGKNYSINDPNLHQVANQTWKDMSKEDRAPYEEKARQEKERLKGTPLQIQTMSYAQRQQNSGSAVQQNQFVADDEFERDEYFDRLVESCVKACATREDLLDAPFFIMGSNIMVKTDKNEYLPLEIGICRYSIRNGIELTYHEFIDAGKVPLGYMRLAKEFAHDFHKIPFENFVPAVKDYQKIVEDIKTILSDSRFTNEVTGKPTPMLVFCRNDAIDQNKGVFEFLAQKYRSVIPGFEWDVEVLDLVNLLFHITNAADQRIPPAVAEGILTATAFDYANNTLCDYHEERDCCYCAQGLARKLCYMLSGTLCEVFGIPVTDKHLPTKRKEVVAETYTGTFTEVRPMPSNRYTDHNSNTNRSEQRTQDQTPESSNGRPQARTPNLLGIGRGRGVVPRNRSDF